METCRCRWDAFGDGCDQPAGHGFFGDFCEPHAARLQAVAEALRMRRSPTAITKKPTGADDAKRAKADRKLALRMAAVVREAVGPITGLAERLNLKPQTSAYRGALKLATDEGWIKLDNGKGHVAGPTAPPVKADSIGRMPVSERARRLAAFVNHRGGRVTRAEAADALGLKSTRGSLTRIARYAVERGMIESKVGGGGKAGYYPVESAAKAA